MCKQELWREDVKDPTLPAMSLLSELVLSPLTDNGIGVVGELGSNLRSM